MIKAIIFDWGGTLAPLPNGGWLGILARELNATTTGLLPYWREASRGFSTGDIDEKTFWTRFERAAELIVHDSIRRKVWEEGSCLHPWKDFVQYAMELENVGIKIAILSNSNQPTSHLLRKVIEKSGFNKVLFSDEIHTSKPATGAYLLALNAVDELPQNCLFVDDLEHNVQAAREMGMKVIKANPNDYKETMDKVRSFL